MNNILYLATNNKGLIKIGITSKTAIERIESFSEKYKDKFSLISSFNINPDIKNEQVETFFHEILNSKLLNINSVYKNNFTNLFKEIIDTKPSGYTEVFVLQKNDLKNLFLLIKLLNLANVESSIINKINNLSENIEYLKEFKKIKIVAKKTDLPKNSLKKPALIKLLLSNQKNIFNKNFKNFINKAAAIDGYSKNSITIKNNVFYLNVGSNITDIANIIHGCQEDTHREFLLNLKLYKFNKFLSLTKIISFARFKNQDISGQFDKNYKSNFFKLNKRFNNNKEDCNNKNLAIHSKPALYIANKFKPKV